MKLTQHTSFWVVIFSAVIGFFVGQIHWILGLIVFFLLAGRALFTALIIDTVFGALEYHHDRNDDRTKKEIASMVYIKALQSGVRPKL